MYVQKTGFKFFHSQLNEVKKKKNPRENKKGKKRKDQVGFFKSWGVREI